MSVLRLQREFCFALACIVTVVFANAGSAAETDQRPNIVIFLVDDMGIMDTSVPFLTDAAGVAKKYPLNEYYRTPNMERLAASGIRFNQFNAMSVCSPSRISIHTGQNAARHRATNWINLGGNNAGPFGPPAWNWEGLKKKDVTLARLLQKAGYRTIHIGKAHFGPGEAAYPQEIGFDVNVAGAGMGRPASYYSEDHFGHQPRGKNAKPNPNSVPDLDKYYDSGLFLTEALTQEAKTHVTQAVEEKRPFFLHMSHYAVHGPFQSDPRFADHYPEDSERPNSPKFATLIEGMDKSLGDLLDHLEKLGVAENTFILFLGDNGSDAPRNDEHGISSSAPLRGKKGTHYEGGTRTPFIASWGKPNELNPLQKSLPVASGGIQPQLASICDIFPTLLDINQIPNPEGHQIDGSSLRTLLTGQPDAHHAKTFLMHYPHKHRSSYFTTYRDGPWKVIYHYLPSKESEDKRYQLFHLENDPAEQNNLAESHPEDLRRLMQGLVTALEEHQALYPVKDGNELKPRLP